MPELRWILLGLGVLFCLGLWWWETRRGRQAVDSRASLKPTQGLTETTAVREAVRRPGAEVPPSRELPPWNSPIDEIAQIVELEELEEVEQGRPREPEQGDVEIELESGPLQIVDGDARGPVSAGIGRIEPIFGDPTSVLGPSETEPPPPGTAAPSTPSTSQAVSSAEKIVTLRVAAPPLERFEGATLVRALQAAGLEHGKFSIFHKITPEGVTLFSVASLVEPGTFDLATIGGRRFPGVSIFAVLKSDSDAGGVLEEMVASARDLASALHGSVQDERGAPLNPPRLAELRAEVFAWTREHGARTSHSQS